MKNFTLFSVLSVSNLVESENIIHTSTTIVQKVNLIFESSQEKYVPNILSFSPMGFARFCVFSIRRGKLAQDQNEGCFENAMIE